MEVVPSKDYCPVDPDEKDNGVKTPSVINQSQPEAAPTPGSDSDQEVSKSTTALMIVVVVLLLVSGALGYLIFVQKKPNVNVVPTTVGITPTVTLSPAQPSPATETLENIETEVQNTNVDDFSQELDAMDTDLQQL